jgi:hypothetical protein
MRRAEFYIVVHNVFLSALLIGCIIFSVMTYMELKDLELENMRLSELAGRLGPAEAPDGGGAQGAAQPAPEPAGTPAAVAAVDGPQGGQGGPPQAVLPDEAPPLGDFEAAAEAPAGEASQATEAAVSVKAGDAVSVMVYSDKVEDVYGYQFELSFDKEAFKYEGLATEIQELGAIFAREFENYVLVGSTMTGSRKGVSGEGMAMCVVRLTALEDGAPLGGISVGNVNTVNSGMKYSEGVGGWRCEAASASPAR